MTDDLRSWDEIGEAVGRRAGAALREELADLVAGRLPMRTLRLSTGDAELEIDLRDALASGRAVPVRSG